MKVLSKPVSFDWDKGNVNKNLRKHGVTDQEAEEVFSNKPLLVSLDRRHSTKREIRYHALGRTNRKKLLFLSFTVRDDKVRIISARPMDRKERRIYVKKT